LYTPEPTVAVLAVHIVDMCPIGSVWQTSKTDIAHIVSLEGGGPDHNMNGFRHVSIPPITTNPSALLEDLDSVAEVAQSGYK
jgi:hypothetical protein